MTDGSHRLLDKHGNEIAFSASGVFEKLIPGDRERVVRAISSGGQTVTFDYTIGAGGDMLIAGARLTGDDTAQATYAVQYEYDGEDRLCAARRKGVETAAAGRQITNRLAMAGK